SASPRTSHTRRRPPPPSSRRSSRPAVGAANRCGHPTRPARPPGTPGRRAGAGVPCYGTALGEVSDEIGEQPVTGAAALTADHRLAGGIPLDGRSYLFGDEVEIGNRFLVGMRTV